MSDSYISYSGNKLFENCEFAYWNNYINYTEIEGPDDRLGSIFGSVTGILFERFYMGKMWRLKEPQAHLHELASEVLDEVIKDETTPRQEEKYGRLVWKGTGVLMWKGEGEGQNPRGLYENREELLADIRDAVARGFRIIRHERLLGPRMGAEVKLDADFEEGKIAGRADFIIKRTKPYHDLCIIDGKGSRWRDKYVDPDQVRWYGMLYKHHHGVAPDKLAFLYWRYDPPESMDWVEFTEEELDELLIRVRRNLMKISRKKEKLARKTIQEARRVFLPVAEKANPREAHEKGCRFCPYALEDLCPKGAEVQEKFRRKK